MQQVQVEAGDAKAVKVTYASNFVRGIQGGVVSCVCQGGSIPRHPVRHLLRFDIWTPKKHTEKNTKPLRRHFGYLGNV